MGTTIIGDSDNGEFIDFDTLDDWEARDKEQRAEIALLRRDAERLRTALQAFVEDAATVAHASHGQPNGDFNDRMWKLADPDGFALVAQGREALAKHSK